MSVRYPGLCVHVEAEERRRVEDPLDAKMLQHGTALIVRYGLPMLPIALCFVVGRAGEEVQRVCFHSEVEGLPVLSYHYHRINVCGLSAERYLEGANPLGYALAARMQRGKLSRARQRGECLRRIMSVEGLADKARGLLLHYVLTYVKLKPEDEKEYRDMMEQVEYAQAREVEMTWSEEIYQRGWGQGRDRGRKEGRDEGRKEGRDEGREEQLRQSIQDLAEAYGLKVSAARREAIGAMTLEPLLALRQHLKSHRRWPRP